MAGDNHEDRKKLCGNKLISVQVDKTLGFKEVETFRFHDNQHKNIVGLSALSTSLIYPPRNIPGTHFCKRLSRPHDHSAAGRIMLMKNYN